MKITSMKLTLLAVTLMLVTATVLAQEPTLPYAVGNVEDFLETNQTSGRPSLVLYNFNLESG